jgi:hypothetical protein
VESMSRTSNPACNNGVATARIPSGAVASILENDATKNTILLEDFKNAPLRPGAKILGSHHHMSRSRSICQQIARNLEAAPALSGTAMGAFFRCRTGSLGTGSAEHAKFGMTECDFFRFVREKK